MIRPGITTFCPTGTFSIMCTFDQLFSMKNVSYSEVAVLCISRIITHPSYSPSPPLPYTHTNMTEGGINFERGRWGESIAMPIYFQGMQRKRIERFSVKELLGVWCGSPLEMHVPHKYSSALEGNGLGWIISGSTQPTAILACLLTIVCLFLFCEGLPKPG